MSTAPNVGAPGAAAAPRSPAPPPAPPARSGKRRAFLIFFAVLLVAAAAGVMYWLHSRNFETTDDAQVETHLDPVTPRVDGTVVKVYVENNQLVKAGDPLVDLDPRDFQVALNQASASLGQAQSQLTAQQPNIPITQ